MPNVNVIFLLSLNMLLFVIYNVYVGTHAGRLCRYSCKAFSNFASVTLHVLQC